MGISFPFAACRAVKAALVSALVVLAAPALAGSFYFPGDRVHADSYGNLVIHSPAGYKRILVGQGHLLKKHAALRDGPRVVYLEDEPYRVRNVYRCIRQPAIVHGRSYMYGLPENVVPVVVGPCK
jgi:hypothetical protein